MPEIARYLKSPPMDGSFEPVPGVIAILVILAEIAIEHGL